jgi:hypothetical protein
MLGLLPSPGVNPLGIVLTLAPNVAAPLLGTILQGIATKTWYPGPLLPNSISKTQSAQMHAEIGRKPGTINLACSFNPVKRSVWLERQAHFLTMPSGRGVRSR